MDKNLEIRIVENDIFHTRYTMGPEGYTISCSGIGAILGGAVGLATGAIMYAITQDADYMLSGVGFGSLGGIITGLIKGRELYYDRMRELLNRKEELESQ